MKATICGAAGGIGQPLSLLLKLHPYIDELSLYDVVNAPGVGADLSHISTNCNVKAYTPEDNGLQKALQGSDLVIIPAGVPRKPGMTRDDLFAINGKIVQGLAEACAISCPNAYMLIISNPVNSTVPIFAEVLRKQGVLDARKIFGITNLDIVRSNTFVKDVLSKSELEQISGIPVIGGHSGPTIVPLLSVAFGKSQVAIKDDVKAALIHRIQYGGDEVVKAKNGTGSATLSMAYAAYEFADKLVRSLVDGKSTELIAYVNLNDKIEGTKQVKDKVGLDYFSIPFVFDNGVKRVKYEILDEISADEKEMLGVCVEQLKGNIEKGVGFVKGVF